VALAIAQQFSAEPDHRATSWAATFRFCLNSAIFVLHSWPLAAMLA
jgi:hypothetical protein